MYYNKLIMRIHGLRIYEIKNIKNMSTYAIASEFSLISLRVCLICTPAMVDVSGSSSCICAVSGVLNGVMFLPGIFGWS